jgi:hypothetical protein
MVVRLSARVRFFERVGERQRPHEECDSKDSVGASLIRLRTIGAALLDMTFPSLWFH